CCLLGKTSEEAARLLDCPQGTVFSRLATAREKLRARLVRRGITLSASLFAAALSQGVSPAAVPPLLIGPTVKAALARAAGQATAVLVSARAVQLAEGVVRGMLLHKLKLTALVLGMLTLIAAGAGVMAHPSPGTTEPNPATESPRKLVADS